MERRHSVDFPAPSCATVTSLRGIYTRVSGRRSKTNPEALYLPDSDTLSLSLSSSSSYHFARYNIHPPSPEGVPISPCPISNPNPKPAHEPIPVPPNAAVGRCLAAVSSAEPGNAIRAVCVYVCMHVCMYVCVCRV